MSNDDNQSNILSQDEIDKLSADISSNSDESPGGMLTQEEIDRLASDMTPDSSPEPDTVADPAPASGNVLSQDEIDKLSADLGGGSDPPEPDVSEPAEDNINISSMLSQDEIDQVAGDLNQLSDQNTELGNNLSQEELDQLSSEIADANNPDLNIDMDGPDSMDMTAAPDESTAYGGDVSSDTKTEAETNIFGDSGSTESEQAPSNLSETQTAPDSESGPPSDSDNNSEADTVLESKTSKKKIIMISSIAAAALIVILGGLYLAGFFSGAKTDPLPKPNPRQKTDGLKKKTAEKVVKKQSQTERKKAQKQPSVAQLSEQSLKSGVDLFFSLYKTGGIDEIIIKSGELIVAHDMDISENKLMHCFAFDLTASIVDREIARLKQTEPNAYFDLKKLNRAYNRRLQNTGRDSEEAYQFLLKNGKRVINLIRDKLKKHPESLKHKII